MIIKYLSAILSFLIIIPTVIPQSLKQLKADISDQTIRIEQLENSYITGNYEKCNENMITDFNLNEALDSGIKYNELRFVGTHNSYQTRSIEAVNNVYSLLSTISFGAVTKNKGEFSSKTLTEQLNYGIRSIELDVETKIKNNTETFVCSHSPFIDMTTNSYNFELALKEIKMWSDNNPSHLPISIIIEPKDFYITLDGFKKFKVNYANDLGNLLRTVLGDTLLEPSDMLRNYANFKEMREADDWLQVKDMLGKVIVLLHESDVTDDYISQDKTIRSQAMFPMLRYKSRNESYASFIIDNTPSDALPHTNELCNELKLVVRTLADTYGKSSDKNRNQALETFSQILSTDSPYFNPYGDYSVEFGEKKTVSLVNEK